MTREPFIAHSELTNEIYIVQGQNKYRVTEQVIHAVKAIKALEQEPTAKNDLGVDCNNCKNNFHRGDRTSYCATGDGMCHYECEDPILDKIRAEIEPTRKMYLEMNDIDWLNGCDYVLSVLDKYKAESEV